MEKRLIHSYFPLTRDKPTINKGFKRDPKLFEEDECVMEEDFLESDEIAMLYDEQIGFIITPLYLSLKNLMEALKLEYYRTSDINGEYSVDYFGDRNNIVKVLHKEKIYECKIILEHESKDIQVKLQHLCIYPEILVKSNDGAVREIDIRPIVGNYKKNVFERATEELLLLYKSLLKPKENYVV